MDEAVTPQLNTSADTEISENILNEFKTFIKIVPANRLNKNLRKMLSDYLFYNMDALPIDFKDLLTDLYWLHELLDEIMENEIGVKLE
ncbi:hypothetical protein GM921_13905 [Pedobacter sp. LMG 31464]|uniref:Uncharacterized protein n=1 Tax=Pedobacter planticolens TaxID=2679964 RepID=A0A923IXQ4_9SPHI|nr:hypothetical protein [Pedobacter planticolens]MBB2146592.1 hypothetical protein [Pedobacter planticolens]